MLNNIDLVVKANIITLYTFLLIYYIWWYGQLFQMHIFTSLFSCKTLKLNVLHCLTKAGHLNLALCTFVLFYTVHKYLHLT